MLHLDADQLAAVTRSHFFARIADFVCAESAVAVYRDAARDKPLRNALWTQHWPTLRQASERDAALFMCFVLACATLHIDVPRAAAAIQQSTDPEGSMRTFLSERGLLRAAAFDALDARRPAGGG
jgi:hypothetical protein